VTRWEFALEKPVFKKRSSISIRQRITESSKLTLLPRTSRSPPHRCSSQQVCRRVLLRRPRLRIGGRFDFRPMSEARDILPRSSTTT
jgi:hypothetical protein